MGICNTPRSRSTSLTMVLECLSKADHGREPVNSLYTVHIHCQPDGTLVRYPEDLIPAVPLDRPSGDELSSSLRVDCSLSSSVPHERPPIIHLRDPRPAPSKRDRHMVVSGNHRPALCATVISMNKLAGTLPENILNEMNKGPAVCLTVRHRSRPA